MIKQLLIGGTLAAAAGYSIPGVPDMLNLSNSNSFATTGAKWESAKFSLGNISFTSSLTGPRINRSGNRSGNSITAIIDASNAELARKNGNSGAKFIKH